MRAKVIGVIIIVVIVLTILLSYVIYNQIIGEQDLLEKQRDVVQRIKTLKLQKLIKHRDLVLQKEDFAQISERQQYVTPYNQSVQEYILNNQITTAPQAYSLAVNWIWVSDQTLHGKQEEWLLPHQFIKETPDLVTNPIPGYLVSDCESQAYTLVSILEGIGMLKEDVRVVIGEVDFSGEIGGHAWIQVYENDRWFALEPTSGPFWDDDDLQLINNPGFPYNFFKNHPYPVVEYWAYFNDRYFYNPHSAKSSPDLPSHWKQASLLQSQ